MALVASACGGRTGLPVDDALANDAAAPEDTTPPSGAVPPALPCVSWKLVAGPTQISSASEDLDLTTMTAAPGGALLSWSVDIDPSDDPFYRARLVGWDGSALAAEQQILPRSASSLNWSAAGFVATKSGFGAFGWDDADGCLFVSLDPTGAPTSPVTVIGQSDCYLPGRSAAGFSLLSSPDPMRVTTVSYELVDESGLVQSSHAIIPTDAYVVSNVDLGDGTAGLLYVSLNASMGPTALVYQRLDSSGTSIAGPATVAAATSGGIMALSGGGLLVVYFDSGQTEALAVPIDFEGVTQGSPVAISFNSSDMGGLDDIGLASIPGGDVLLTWLDGDEGPGDVFAMSLSPEGVARGMPSLVWQAPLVLPESTVLASVRPDGQEAVVGVSAWLDPNASEQVVTLGIQCVH